MVATSHSELGEEKLSDILRKHKLNNEERRRKFFEDDQTNESFASKIKHQEWIEDIEKEVNKLHSATPLEQQPSINNYQLSNT